MRYYYSIFQNIRERYLMCFQDMGRVLMFHQVSDDKDKWDDENFSITKISFEKLLMRSIGKEYLFKKISDIEKSTLKCRYITFDDGYEEIYNSALPILKKFNIPFAVFITTGFINKKGYLNGDMVKCLAAEPLCTIGSHTKNHLLLRQESTGSARNEILQSKNILETLMNKPVDYFAFPYGSIYACSKRDIDLVKECRYDLAFSTLSVHISQKSLQNKYFIPRINVNEKNWFQFY